MIGINKLLGFFELPQIGIPTIKWKEYNNNTILSDNKMWTIRLATIKGNDFNLPRAVGVKSEEAVKFAKEMQSKYKGEALIIYYPYFVALKSGTMQLAYKEYIIEAVKKDLWNLVTHDKPEITYINKNGDIDVFGDIDFFNNKELEELKKAEKLIRGKFRNILIEGKILLLEWSFGSDSDKNGDKIGESYLIFYECRTI